MKPSELVKKAMDRQGVKTAYALAKLTGISEDSLKNYERDKVGKNGISNDFARRLAEAAGLNPLEVIVELEIARASDEATRSAWGKALATIRNSRSALVGIVASTALAQSFESVKTLGACLAKGAIIYDFVQSGRISVKNQRVKRVLRCDARA